MQLDRSEAYDLLDLMLVSGLNSIRLNETVRPRLFLCGNCILVSEEIQAHGVYSVFAPARGSFFRNNDISIVWNEVCGNEHLLFVGSSNFEDVLSQSL